MSTGARTGWTDVKERGSSLGIRFFVILVTSIGRAAGRAFLRVVVLYYALTSPTARRSSRAYLTRLGEPTGFRAVYRHLLTFAECTLDRIFFIRGQTDRFDVRTNGHEHLAALRENRQGALLLGAHLGSFEAMRAQADVEAIPVHVVANFGNARMINDALGKLNPESKVRLLELERGLDFIFHIKERIEAGELVAILADRVTDGQRSLEVPFLGDPAPFPTGAYMLASSLGCPVYLTFGLYRGGNRYDLYCEPFAERVELPRKRRSDALEGYVQRYADRLAHHCRLAPHNWFNFFDFWSHP